SINKRCAISSWRSGVGSADVSCAFTLCELQQYRQQREQTTKTYCAARLCAALDAIARMFMAIFEGEFGDSRFVELAQTFGDHAVVLFLGRARERQIEAGAVRELKRDSTVLRRVRGGEKAGMLAVLHVFAIG